MGAYFGNVMVLLPERQFLEEIPRLLHQAGLRLDDTFVCPQEEIWEEENVVAAALPPDTRWLTCWDPVCRQGFDPDLAEELAQIYGSVFHAPALSFSVEDGELLLMGCFLPTRHFSRWYARGSKGILKEYGISSQAGAFPQEVSRLLPTPRIFPFHRVWSAPGIGQEEERLMDMAALFGFAPVSLDEGIPPPVKSRFFRVPYGI